MARGIAISIALHTILEHGGPIELDHNLIRIFVFLHVTHCAQVLGLHQRCVLAISLLGGCFNWGEDTVAESTGRCRQLLHAHISPPVRKVTERLLEEKNTERSGESQPRAPTTLFMGLS